MVVNPYSCQFTAEPRHGRGRVRLAAVICCCLLAIPVTSGAVTFRAQVDRTRVSPGDQITLKVTLEGDDQSLPSVELRHLEGVDIYTGGTSQSYSFINGKTSAAVSTTFYLVVRTDRSFTIPALTVELQGQIYRTQPIPIVVVPSSAPSSGQGSRSQAPGSRTPDRSSGSSSAAGRQPGDEIFITLFTDKARAYVGEQIVLTFRFHRRVRLWDSPKYTAPKTEGFWREDMPPERTYVEVIAGYRYTVTELRYALFPTRPGRLNISPAEVTIPVDVFDRFFSSRRDRTGPQRLRTGSLNVDISALPIPSPVNYSGVVASQLTLTAAVGRDTVPRGEPVSLKIDLTADGFLKSFEGLPVVEPEGARIHDALQRLDVDKSGEKLLSHFHLEKVIVPTREGILRLEPIQIAYFNPTSHRYETVRKDGARLVVTPSDLPVAGDDVSGFLRSEIARLGRDLAFIHPVGGDLRTRRAPRAATATWWIVLVMPLLLLVLLRWQLSRLERLRRDPVGLRRRRALVTARGLLDAAGRERDPVPGLTGLARAVYAYVADRTGRSPAGLAAVDVSGYAEFLGLPTVGERLAAILTVCDNMRFGSERAVQDVTALLGETRSLLAQLEKASLQKKTPAAAVQHILLLTWLILGVVTPSLLAQEAPGVVEPPTQGPDPIRLLAEGNQAYTSGDIAIALTRYREALTSGVNDAVLHYNLGNAYARQGELGRAISCYLRAQRLTPRDREVRANLAWVRSHIKDLELQSQPMPPVIAAIVSAVRFLSLDEWSLVLVCLVWLLSLLVAMGWYRGRITDMWRRLLIATSVALALTLVFTAWLWYEEQIRVQAVVVVVEVEVHSGPADSFPVVFRIHDGLTLTIRGQRDDWLRIGLGGDWIGWVPEGSVERILLAQGEEG